MATLTVLGAGSILPRTGYGCSSYALRPEESGPVTLLDCGPGTTRQLAPAGIELHDVRRVVLSHYHTDHCLDVFALAFARRSPFLAPPPQLAVYGPRGLDELLGSGGEVFGRWGRDPARDVHVVEVDGEGRGGFEADGLVFTCARTLHTPNAVAWRVDLPSGESLAYSGDTGENPAVAELARGVDLFVCECSFPDAEAVEHHLTPSSAARLARDAGVKRLVLSHFYPSNDPETARAVAAETFDGPIELARDGAAFGLTG